MKVESISFNNVNKAHRHSLRYIQHPQTFKNTQPDSFQTTLNPRILWLHDRAILGALDELKKINFNPSDVKKLKENAIILPFQSGSEAADFIIKSNIRIKFDKLSSPNIHAQYDYDDNFIKINELYKGTQNPSEISAIAGAILHEAGHAKDSDGHSSIQEELECLALNAVAYRSQQAKNEHAQTSDALIIKEGVELYSKLFFEEPNFENLIKRVKDKYGFLSVGDFKHPPSKLAYMVKDLY